MNPEGGKCPLECMGRLAHTRRERESVCAHAVEIEVVGAERRMRREYLDEYILAEGRCGESGKREQWQLDLIREVSICIRVLRAVYVYRYN